MVERLARQLGGVWSETTQRARECTPIIAACVLSSSAGNNYRTLSGNYRTLSGNYRTLSG